MTKAVSLGLGRHIMYLPLEQLQLTGKYCTLMGGVAFASTLFSRISFCAFLIQTVGTERNVRILLWACIVTQALVNSFGIILQYAICGSHMSVVWNYAPDDPVFLANCIPFYRAVGYVYFSSGRSSVDTCLLGSLY